MPQSQTDPGYIENKEKVKNRLRRISGQIGGIERMVDEERYCIDILTQISAAQAAIDKVALALLDEHTRHCVVGAETAEAREAKTEEMMEAVGRLLKSR
ncbi:MAG TPA: metal-sensitive transcriptional regulator [Solirubrobacterales bacterium]|nr:metal-sensitive transcriptional regulator [Solirubrobacterales bacterium]